MADLKQLFHDCGFREVITYIQSGNVIFESDHDKSLLPDVISHAFEKRFAFQSHVVLRSGDEMHAMMSAFPFTNEEMAKAEAKNPDVEHVYVFLSGSTIDSAAAEALRLAYDGEDKFHAAEHELYLLCYNGVRDSRLAASFSKLDASLTARNQKTLLKICELLDADKPDSSAH